MQWFKDLKLTTKFLAGLSVIAAIAVVIGLVGYANASRLAAAGQTMYTDQLAPIRDLGFTNAAVLTARGDTRNLLDARTRAEREKFAAVVEEQTTKADEYVAKFTEKELTSEEQELVGAFLESWENYKTLRNEAIAQALDMRDAEATALLDGEARIAQGKARDALRALIEMKAHFAEQLQKDEASQASAAEMQILLFMAIGVLLAFGLGLTVARAISKPVIALAGQAEQVASGDLTVQVVAQSKDEVGHLAASFRTMVENLRQTIGQVHEASRAVSTASSEISTSTEEMAAGAQEQTTQATEVASAVEEMTKTIVENSRNAVATADTARRAQQAAEQGGRVVEETVSGMKMIADVVNSSASTVRALGKSSAQIGEIIGVIDDIADQTNLLALNAAIEAARAGDQGRGFAVVADEVRKLAERTTRATQEIAKMIKAIQAETGNAVASMEHGTRQVAEGITHADKAGSSLKEIVGMIQELTDMVARIAAASEQQSSTSEQISKNVEAISSVTNQSAAGIQQIARASDDLNRLTEQLQQQIMKFTLSAESAPAEHHASGSRLQGKSSPEGGRPLSPVAVRANGGLVLHQ